MLKKRTLPHIIARKRLLDYIRKMPSGSDRQLPPELVLCSKLDLNLGTMKKALKLLAQENRITIVPRKGNFVTDVPTHFKIGIIFRDILTKITNLKSPETLEGIIGVLKKNVCSIHFIRSSRPKEIPALLQEYNFDAAFWYLPDFPFPPEIAKIVKVSPIPIALMAEYCPMEFMSELPPTHFIIDHHGIGRVRTEFMLRRGHRNIACFTHKGGEAHQGYISALEKAGITHNPSWQMEKDEIQEKINRILEEGKVTAIIMDGGYKEQLQAFQTLEKHPNGVHVELLLDYVGHAIHDIIKLHPKIKIAGLSMHPVGLLGQTAAAAILANLKDGTPLKPVKLSSTIISPDGTPFESCANWQYETCQNKGIKNVRYFQSA